MLPVREVSAGMERGAAHGGVRGAPAWRVTAREVAPASRRYVPRIAADRVLVVRLGSLGDVVRTRFALPAIRALYPHAHLAWLVEDRSAPGLVGVTELDEVVEVPRKSLHLTRPAEALRTARDVVLRIRAGRYDLAIDFHSILKSALPVSLAGVERRLGYGPSAAREGAHRLFTDRVELAPRHVSRFARNAALVRYLAGEGDAPDPLVPPRLSLDRAAMAPPPGLPEAFAILHPGTSASTLYKRWEPERFAWVARGLRDARALPSVVTWGPVPGERECAERVVALSEGAAVLAPATGSLAAFLGLLSRARIFVGSDSGPMHLAALAGRPIVVVFGPTDSVENGPFPGVPHRVLRVDVGCNPCRAGCPARACMAAVAPPVVLDAALGLLDAGAPGG